MTIEPPNKLKNIFNSINLNKNNGFDEKTLLYVLGAAKTGTTWLWEYFKTHEQVYAPMPKELNFFNCKYLPDVYKKTVIKFDEWLKSSLKDPHHKKNLKKNLVYKNEITYLLYREKALKNEKHYIKYFKDHIKNEKCFVDITPSYHILPSFVFEKMQKTHPHTKFLFIMRDPLERYCSLLKQQFPIQVLCDEAIEFALSTHLHKLINDHRITIDNLESVIPKEDILYCFYENLFCDETVKQICDFIGVEYKSANYKSRFAQTGNYDFSQDSLKKIFDAQKETYEYIFKRFGEKTPQEWHTTYNNWIQKC